MTSNEFDIIKSSVFKDLFAFLEFDIISWTIDNYLMKYIILYIYYIEIHRFIL